MSLRTPGLRVARVLASASVLLLWRQLALGAVVRCEQLHPGDRNWVDQSEMLPTQAVVSIPEVNRNVAELNKFKNDKNTGDEVKDWLMEGALSVVVGPNGRCYVVDGHHHWRAGFDSEFKVTEYYVNVLGDRRIAGEDFKSLSPKEQAARMADFWVELARVGRAWLIGPDGKLLQWVDREGNKVDPLKGDDAQTFLTARNQDQRDRAAKLLGDAVKAQGLTGPDMPTKIDQLVYDTYRALAKFLETAKGYDKAATAQGQLFQQFYWGEALRNEVDLPLDRKITREDWHKAIMKGMKFAASHRARKLGLPGALPKKDAPRHFHDTVNCIVDGIIQ